MIRVKQHTLRICTPALLTGTSSEYLGRKPWPRVVRERMVSFVLGPEGVGKSSVAQRIAAVRSGPRDAAEHTVSLNTRQLQHAVLDRVRRGKWSADLLQVRALVLDGPVWLRNRAGLVDMLAELLRARAAARRRTVVCQTDNDGSVEALMGAMEAGSIVVIGLRFPKGRRGRLRYGRRVCDALGIPRDAARGTESLEPWRYDLVSHHLSRWPDAPAPTRLQGESPVRTPGPDVPVARGVSPEVGNSRSGM